MATTPGAAGPQWQTDSFEQLYRDVGDDLEQIPWSDGAPDEQLVGWLERLGPGRGRRGLVIGCGLGEDAEELGRRGWAVTAFDFSPTAIEWCRRRHPRSPVDYVVADLLDLPSDFTRAFDAVVEIYTIQSISLAQRPATLAALADTVAPEGRLFVRCMLRGDDDPVADRPWPVSRRDLLDLDRAGLTRVDEDTIDRGPDRLPVLVADYVRRR